MGILQCVEARECAGVGVWECGVCVGSVRVSVCRMCVLELWEFDVMYGSVAVPRSVWECVGGWACCGMRVGVWNVGVCGRSVWSECVGVCGRSVGAGVWGCGKVCGRSVCESGRSV